MSSIRGGSGRIPGPWFPAAAVFAIVLLAAIFLRFGLSVPDFLKYLFGLLMFTYIPGRVILRAAGLEPGRPAAMALSLALGLTSTVVIYKLAAFAGAEILYFLWVFACAAVMALRAVKRPPRPRDLVFRVTPAGAGMALVAGSVLLMLVADNYHNALRQPDGSVVVHMRAYDGFLRDAVVRELSHSVPPQMPFASGYPLSYHYGMDLFNSIFYKYLHVGVPDLNHRLSMTFFFALLLLTSYLLIGELGGSATASVLGAFLVVFGGGGLSYLSTLFWGIRQWGNVFFTFHFVNFVNVNSFLPGLAVLLAGFFALSRYLRSDGPSWLPVSAFLLAASLEFKVFFAFPLFAALGVSAIAALLLGRGPRLVKAALLTGAFSVPLAAAALLSNRGGPRFLISPEFVDWIRFTLADLKLRALLEPWTGLVHHARITPVALLSALAAVALFFLGGFGLNALALPSLLRGMKSGKEEDRIRLFLGSFAAACVAYFFFARVSLDGKPRNFTNSYVYTMAPIVLGFFWAERLGVFLAGKRRAWKVLAVAGVVALSVPSTARFLWVKVGSPQPLVISRAYLEAADWLSRNSPGDAVVMTAPEVRLVCYFADRRVVLEDSPASFVSWHLTQAQEKERKDDISRFFGDPRPNGDALVKYHVSYVWMRTGDGRFEGPGDTGFEVAVEAGPGTGGAPSRPKTLRLEPVFRNAEHRIFKVAESPPGS
jgi:hypothetical protein